MRWLLILVSCAAFAADTGREREEYFEKRVRPLLAAKCFACHTDSKLGGLRVDARTGLVEGGKSGPAIVPGDPDASLLIQAVSRSHERLKMPPSDPLTPAEIDALRTWIQAGAFWPETPQAKPAAPEAGGPVITAEQRAFWAFQPIRKVAPPEVRDRAWARTAIDRFVLAKLEAGGLSPVEPADKAALLRRATFDLTGLPPTPEEVADFLADTSPEAWERVVDRMLASPRYGERWGRYWLDLARYADGQLGASRDTPYSNAFRYRDWVIRAFNEDLPYDRMIRSQIAADLLEAPDQEKLLPGLGFQALGGDAHERVDVTTKTFLGLTVGCAQCHDHKYDPIPTRDYYSLYGVFTSTEGNQIPLAPPAVVQTYKDHKKRIDDQRERIDDFIRERSTELGEMLVHDTARYLMAAWDRRRGETGLPEGLDQEILDRWLRYLESPKKDHVFLDPWFKLLERGPDKVSREEAERVARDFEKYVLDLFAEQHEIDDRNYVKLGGAKGVKDEQTRQWTNLESLDIERYYLWRDLASDPFQRNGVYFPGGIYYFGITSAMRRDFEVRGGDVPQVKDIDPFLGGHWQKHLDRMRTELAELERTLPPEYPFLHTVHDKEKPANAQIHIRGDNQNLGPEVPRRFLEVLSKGEPAAFAKGSGRLELAEAIASHPLAARVMANRIWHLHFGQGIVRSPSNFGQLGERPTHPELLEYLAGRFIDQGWSVKSLHREIVLSSTYRLSTKHSKHNYAADPDNRLLWRANLRERLDAEAMRDALLAVAGNLELTPGGPPAPLEDDSNHRRTVYAYISRTTLDSTLALFDFPNPNNTSEQRSVTLGPLQRLYFMNNEFVSRQAETFGRRLEKAAATDEERIRYAYLLAFGRQPDSGEIQAGKEFLAASGSWSQYAGVLLSSAEFVAIN